MATDAPANSSGDTQLRNTIIISVSVAAGLAVLIVIACVCYRWRVKKEEDQRLAEKEEAKKRNAARRDQYQLTIPAEPHPNSGPAAAPAPGRGGRPGSARERPGTAGHRRGVGADNVVQAELQNINNISFHVSDAVTESHGSGSPPLSGSASPGRGGLLSPTHRSTAPASPNMQDERATRMMLSGSVAKDKDEDFDTLGEAPASSPAVVGSPSVPKGAISASLLTKNASFRLTESRAGTQSPQERRAVSPQQQPPSAPGLSGSGGGVHSDDSDPNRYSPVEA